MARALQKSGFDVVVVDDLSTGLADSCRRTCRSYDGSILDGGLLVDTIRDHGVTGVIHVAGFKYAGVSVQRPLHTYEQNVTGTAVLLAAMQDEGVDQIVFSSSAAVYGTPDVDLVTEDTPKHPESPYGESKLIGEWLLRDQAVATGLRHTSLRYFNVVGSPAIRPSTTRARTTCSRSSSKRWWMGAPRASTATTTRHQTAPTCAITSTSPISRSRTRRQRGDSRRGRRIEPAYNLGSGDGLSVGQIMAAIGEVTGIHFEPEIGPRRAGDPARIVAAGELAARDLDWRMRHSLNDMVSSAWTARRRVS